MVDLADIPDFTGRPGQHPTPGTAPDTAPVAVVIVTSPLDAEGLYTPVSQAAVDAFIAAEVSAGRAYSATVARWSPWSPLQLPLTLGTARAYNYARCTLPDGSKWYGYLSADYLNAKDTVFTVTPDDCTTYPYSIGYSTWKFGHVAVAASQSDTYGNLYLDAPEPVDVSPEYGQLLADLASSDMADMKAIVLSTNRLDTNPFRLTTYQENIDMGAHPFDEPFAATNLIPTYLPRLGYPGYVMPDPLIWWRDGDDFYVPNTASSGGSTIDGAPQAAAAYVFTMGGLRRYLTIMQSAPWVVQGITEIRFVPNWAVDGGADSSAGIAGVGVLMLPTSAFWAEATGLASAAYTAEIVTNVKNETLLAGWRETVLAAYGASNYRKLITSAGGTSIALSSGDTMTEFKPEAWLSSGLEVDQIATTYGGVRVIPIGYGGLLGGELGITLEFGGSVTPGQGGSGLAHQHGQASQQANSFQLRKSVDLAILSALITQTVGVDVASFQSGMNAVTGTLNGVVGGATAGGGAGAAVGGSMGVINGLLGITAAMAVTGLTTTAAFNQAILQLLTTFQQALPASHWSQGDDTYAVPGSGGGARVDGAWQMKAGRGARLIIKVAPRGKIRTLLSQWDRHGYAIDRAFVPPRLDPMDHRSYWQGEGVIILGAVPSDAKSRIAARFERGTTIVTAIAEIGQQTTNAPRAGVSY